MKHNSEEESVMNIEKNLNNLNFKNSSYQNVPQPNQMHKFLQATTPTNTNSGLDFKQMMKSPMMKSDVIIQYQGKSPFPEERRKSKLNIVKKLI